MKKRARSGIWVSLVFLLAIHTTAQTQAPAGEPSPPPQAEQSANTPPAPQYTPKFKGDPAHSEAEALALGYIRTFLTAERLYYKKHDKYTKSLQELAASPGSFTRRMTNTDRGDYLVEFHPQAKGSRFALTLTPKTFDAQHRAFFADDTGVIRVDETKPATEDSPKL
jgi:hypothetical protein